MLIVGNEGFLGDPLLKMGNIDLWNPPKTSLLTILLDAKKLPVAAENESS